MDYSYYPTDYYRQNERLRKDIAGAINGEFSAIQCYERIASLSPSKKAREQILEIRKDEIRHYQQFTQIYTNLFGSQPIVKAVEECPSTFSKGLEFGFNDEQETVDKYLEISSYAQDPGVREAFRRAAADEQNHAVWFLYFMTKGQS
ncbi:ferritin-like domain-containing protein [Peribacillus sp. SCS-37]|uniref:ferritin-like domain-containing protein n=1 Tax=Paraperibacillus esterisolvens TaxID=3115296 RepID=UPI003905FF16